MKRLGRRFPPVRRLHLRLIAVIGVIVPGRLRADWRQEWEAELRHREARLAEWERLDRSHRLDLLRRSLGAFWDALRLQPRRWEDEMIQDLRYGIRMLVKNPGFSLIAILTLALGISANVTIFAIISSIFLQPLPVKNPDQLVLVLQKDAVWKMPHGTSWLDYLDYRARVEPFEDAIAVMMNPVHLSSPGQQPERAWVEAVSDNYFSVLGVEPAQGRLIQPGEGKTINAAPIIVLSHRYWQSKFGGDPGVVGRTIIINGHPFTVIGVAAEKFQSAQWAIDINAFVPASMLGQLHIYGSSMLQDRASPVFKVFARLKPGATLAQARASVEIVAQQIAAEWPKEHKDVKVLVMSERQSRPEPTVAEFMPLAGSVFMAMAGLVLLIACANVANLMFSRALVRQREMGIRTAIGASRARLIRQLLVESVILASAAGVAGLLLTTVSGGLIARLTPAGEVPTHSEARWDWRVLAFTFAVSVAAGVVTGIGPALRATRLDVQATLKAGAVPIGSRRHLFRSGLVISQVAICFIILVAGGLFVRSMQQIDDLDLGLRTDHLLIASVDVRLQGYSEERGQQFYRQLLERITALPGARAASVALTVPFSYNFDIASVAAEQQAGNDPDNFSVVHCNRVGHDYLKTIGTALLRGRGFSEQDTASSPRVAIINEAMAQQFWPGEEALGKRFRRGVNGDLWEVVGITPTGRYVMIGEAPRPYFYVPITQNYTSPATVVVWTEPDPAAMLPAVRQVIKDLDPHLPIYNELTIEAHLRRSAFGLMPLRLGATFAGLQGLLGLLLAAMGVYGVVSYVASQRTREIGIRMALGAQRREIFRLVVRDGLRLTLIGVSLGLIAALGLRQILAQILYNLTPAAAPVIAAVTVLLAAVALFACYLPARRATKVDPLVALRHE
jgi:predicted permease